MKFARPSHLARGHRRREARVMSDYSEAGGVRLRDARNCQHRPQAGVWGAVPNDGTRHGWGAWM